MSSRKTWLITGASSGLGLETSMAALRDGHRVVGTGRNIAKAAKDNPNFERLGGRWVQLDIGRPDAQQVLEQVVAEESKTSSDDEPVHWVVVNNAGATLLGAAEDMSDGQVIDYLQTNVLGTIRVWKALLPTLRLHRTGTLVTISSIWGFQSKAEHMMYSAVKASQESLTESYAELLSPFGVRTLIVEPGGFRTPFAGNNQRADGGISDDYREPIQKWIDIVDAAGKNPNMVNGDPKLFGQRVVDAVEKRGLFEGIWARQDGSKPLRIELGSDCHDIFESRLAYLKAAHGAMECIASSTDAKP